MDNTNYNAIIYGVAFYKVLEPLILKYTGKKEKQCDFMEGRVRSLEERLAVVETTVKTENKNFSEKLNSIDTKLDKLISDKLGSKKGD